MKLFRHIRHRICRTIYYADQCPNDCRKNYKALGILIAQGVAFSVVGFIIMFAFVLMSV